MTDTPNTPTPPPWPPEAPLRPSLYGIVVRRGRVDLGDFYIEAADGSSLTSQQLGLGSAIAAGFPVDKDDPGWKIR
jgi:hypothetical protein